MSGTIGTFTGDNNKSEAYASNSFNSNGQISVQFSPTLKVDSGQKIAGVEVYANLSSAQLQYTITAKANLYLYLASE